MQDPYLTRQQPAPPDVPPALGFGPSQLRQRRKQARKPNYHLRRFLGALMVLGLLGGAGAGVVNVFRAASRPPAVLPACDPPDRINVLVVGIDPKPLPIQLPDSDKGARRLADTLMVFSLDAKATRGYVLSIPRETRATLGQVGDGVLGDALALGGLTMVRDAIEQLTGLTIQHHVAVDLDAARTTLEQLGPLEVHLNRPIRVEEPSLGIELSREAGWNILRPDDVLAFGFERTEDELDRLERQQMLVAAWQAKLHDAWNVAWVSHAMTRSLDKLETDLPKQAFEAIFEKWRAVAPHDLAFTLLPGDANDRGEWLLAPRRWEHLLARLQNTPRDTAPTEIHPTVELLHDAPEDARVLALASTLQAQGFQVVHTAQATQVTDETLIVERPDGLPAAKPGAEAAPAERSVPVLRALLEAVGPARVEVATQPDSAYGARLTVRLGKRFFRP
ncbi:MAG: LCP family protein [Candidatus Sericytochromatia bacterium]|nr:LCP family protein [Candidatus Sericytochromatia bacterium]